MATVGQILSVRASWDGKFHTAIIIDIREVHSDHQKVNEYYVHYLEYNKRLDEWVSEHEIDLLSSTEIHNVTSIDLIQNIKASASAFETDVDSVATYELLQVDVSSSEKGEKEVKVDASKELSTLKTLVDPHSVIEIVRPSTLIACERMTRAQKRRHDEIYSSHTQDLDPTSEKLEREHEEKTKVKNVHSIQFGKFEIDAWYWSPYPGAYGFRRYLYICDSCLRYCASKNVLNKHIKECKLRHPPGDEIFRSQDTRTQENDQKFAIFEVDGSKNKLYCQSLCLLAKLFLDHKTLYFDVDGFLFYILCEISVSGFHFAGYFSKEKASDENFNLACILILPPYQKKGYGSFLIDFSYELSRREGKIGTPERPLSDLGQVGYRSYWKRAILSAMLSHSSRGKNSYQLSNSQNSGTISIREIEDITGISSADITWTLQSLGMLKYWKGEHIINTSRGAIEEHFKGMHKKNYLLCDSSKILWKPKQ